MIASAHPGDLDAGLSRLGDAVAEFDDFQRRHRRPDLALNAGDPADGAHDVGVLAQTEGAGRVGDHDLAVVGRSDRQSYARRREAGFEDLSGLSHGVADGHIPALSGRRRHAVGDLVDLQVLAFDGEDHAAVMINHLEENPGVLNAALDAGHIGGRLQRL